jgi:hypothetical protein
VAKPENSEINGKGFGRCSTVQLAQNSGWPHWLEITIAFSNSLNEIIETPAAPLRFSNFQLSGRQ